MPKDGVARAPRRDSILRAARHVLEVDPRATIGSVATEAGVSRATVHRYCPARADLLAAIDLAPDPGSRDRILAAAAELVGRDGLRNLSMDELATLADVSRASVYRLFPGKPALFQALVIAYSPFQAVEETLARFGDRPPEEVLPAVASAAARTMAPRIGIARSLLFEVTAGSPEAIEAVTPVIRRMLQALGGYLAGQMAAGRLRTMHPLLAAQLLIGPVFFHLMTRPIAARVAELDVSLEDAINALAETTVRGLAPDASTKEM